MVGKIITKTTTINFQIKTFGLYAVSITARCQSGKLLGLRGGENLRVEIDDIQLREVPSEDKPQYVDIPPTWNGTELKGLAKTVIFILALDKGDHTLKFVPTPSATIPKRFMASNISASTTKSQNIPRVIFQLSLIAISGPRFLSITRYGANWRRTA